MKISRIRGIVAACIAALIVAGLATRIGSGTWSAFGIDQIVALCPVGALEIMLGAREILLHPLILLGVVLVLAVVVGKAFCAWACPVPWLQRLFRPQKKRPSTHAHACGMKPACAGCAALAPVGGKRDGLRIDTRHFALVGALGSAAIFGFPVFCLVCPVGLISATIVGLWHLFQFSETSWGLVVFPIILLVEVVFFRKWCAKICPISALISLVSGLNRTCKPRVDEGACLRGQGVDCHACVDACPEQVDPHTRLIPECSKCGACIEACPAHAIELHALPAKRKEPTKQ